MRYRLRTLLIAGAIGPPAIWLLWLVGSYVVRQFEHSHGAALGPWLATAVVGVAAGIYLFVPPPGRGQPTFRTLLMALAVLVAGFAAIGILENLVGGFDYGP